MKFRLMAVLGLLLMLPVDPVLAQSGRAASSRSQDLWGIWREGFTHYEKAEKARTAKRYEEALNEYRASLQAFQQVRRRDSDWNRTVISYRIDLCLRRINLVQEAQTAAQTKKTKTPAKPATVQQKAAPVLKQVVQREDFVEQAMKARARLAEAEKEIASLKRSIELNSKAAEQVKSLIREKNELIQKNAAINLLLENAKARLARVDKNAEKDRRIVEERAKVTALTSQLKTMRVEMETLKLQKAEAQSRRNEAELALKQNVQHITTLTAAIEAAKQVRTENQKLLAQLNEMKNDKAQMEKRLADASRRINDLSGQLSKIREGIDLPENIRRIQDNANVVLKDNEYLRTLNTMNMKELELLRKSNAAASEELAKLKELSSRSTAERAAATKAAEVARAKLEAERKVSSDYRNTVELLQKERDQLKKDLSAFAQKYETLLKSASRTDTLSAELLKRDAELKKLGERSAGLDLALTKLRQENTMLAAEAKKAREEVRAVKAQMEQKLAALKASNDRISGENASLKKETAALKDSLAKSAEIEKRATELSSENARLRKESSDLKSSIERFGRESVGGKLLAAENDRLKSRTAGLENDLKQAVAAKTALAAEYGVVAAEVFLKQGVEERISFGVEQIEVVHAVFLAAEFRLVVRESQRVGRDVDFGDDLDAVVLGENLKVDELLLGVVAVTRSQARVRVALQTESRVGFVPVLIEVLLETVVVQVNLEAVHLVVRHYLHVIAQVLYGEELAPAVNHEATQAVVGPVAHGAAGQLVLFALLAHLQERAGGPVNAGRRRGGDGDAVAHLDGVPLAAKALVFFQGEADVAGLGLSGCGSEAFAEHFLVVAGQLVGNAFEGRVAFGVDDAGFGGRRECAFCSFPFFQLGDDERFRVRFCIQVPRGCEHQRGGEQESFDVSHNK